jgi:hypothetical protein|tara:strand:- start:251 stop:817 length:567 start_codon:yes stop_codon:yes gene_type:complete
MSKTSQTVVVPHIEENIPLPKNAKEALPEMTVAEEINARTNTIKMLSDITDEVIEPTTEDIEKAESLAKEMMINPDIRPEFDNYPNETMAYLAGMVAQTNCMLVKNMADFKLHVLNRAVQEAETAKSSRERLAALRMIGEIDGVDAFKRKTEITHINKTGEELEKELRETIEQLKGKIVEGEVIHKDD